MTIQEAIKTGKPFKRVYWTVWMEVKEGMFWALGGNTVLYPEDVLATDWEIKP